MYKVLRIEPYVMTRSLDLLNEETEAVFYCFDDSDISGDPDFSFMEVGKSYDCKLSLFGDVVRDETPDCLLCKVIGYEKIGVKERARVQAGKEIFYIPKWKVENLESEPFLYRYSRIDLIQVDDVIHGDFLEDI